jgi:hypothetical protein
LYLDLYCCCVTYYSCLHVYESRYGFTLRVLICVFAYVLKVVSHFLQYLCPKLLACILACTFLWVDVQFHYSIIILRSVYEFEVWFRISWNTYALVCLHPFLPARFLWVRYDLVSRVLLMTLCVCLSKWSMYGFGTSCITYVLFPRCATSQVESCLLTCYNLHMLTLMVNMYLHKCSLVPILLSPVFKTLEVALVHYSSFKEDFLLQTQDFSKCTTFAKYD